MPSHAHITLVGHLGREPETRTLTSGQTVTSFSLATNDKRKDQEDLVSWWNCSCWGKAGEIIAQYTHKGDALLVSGAISQRPYIDRDGYQALSCDVNVRDFTLLGSKRDASPQAAQAAPKRPAGQGADQSTGQGGSQARTAANMAMQAPADDAPPFDDGIPF